MNCKEAYTLMHEHLDGALDEAAQAAFEAHVHGCMACAQQLDAYRQIDGMLGRMERAEAPAGFSDGVIAKLKASGRIKETVPARQPARGWSLPWRWRVPAAAVAVLLLAAFVFPATISMLTGMAGKGAVIASDAYIEAQEQASRVSVLSSAVDGLATTARMLKAVAFAFFSVLATLGSVFKAPVVALIVFLSVGVGVYVRFHYKRGAHHASLSI